MAGIALQPGAAPVLNQLAREQMKLKLLTDIRVDLLVCELEGIPPREYLDDLKAMIDELVTQNG